MSEDELDLDAEKDIPIALDDDDEELAEIDELLGDVAVNDPLLGDDEDEDEEDESEDDEEDEDPEIDLFDDAEPEDGFY